MADQPMEQESINVPLEHVGLEETPIVFVNQFLARAQTG